MAIETFLRRLVVIRRYQQRRVGLEAFRRLGHADGFPGAIRAGARDDLASSSRGFHGEADRLQMLVVVQGGGLARGADGDKPVHPAVNLAVDQPRKRLRVHPVVPKGRDHRRVGSFKWHKKRS